MATVATYGKFSFVYRALMGDKERVSADNDANLKIRDAIEAQLNDNSLVHGSQCEKVLVLVANYLHDKLHPSLQKLEVEQKLRQACEEQLSGLSEKVNDLKGEYSRTLKLREDEVAQYEKEIQTLLEGNKRKADLLTKARSDWSKLQNAPELLQKKREQLVNMEKVCMTKHVPKSSPDFMRRDQIKSMSVDQLKIEVTRTWKLITQQQKVLEKLLEQLHCNLDINQSVVHDCNGNVVQVPNFDGFVNVPELQKTTLGKHVQSKSTVDVNTTQCLLDALASIGKISKLGELTVNKKKVKKSKSAQKSCDQSTHPQSEAMMDLNARIDKFEKIVKSFDDEKLKELNEKLSQKITSLEAKAQMLK